MHTAAVLLSVSVFFQFSIRIRLERHGSFSSSSSSFSTRGCGIHTFLLHNNTEHGLSTSLLSVSIVPFLLLLFYGTYIHVDIRDPSTSGNSRSSWKTWWICSGAVWLLSLMCVWAEVQECHAAPDVSKVLGWIFSVFFFIGLLGYVDSPVSQGTWGLQ